MKVTVEAFRQVLALRTKYPWAVVDRNQVVVQVFNYRAEAKAFERLDPASRTAFDASGCVFEEPPII